MSQFFLSGQLTAVAATKTADGRRLRHLTVTVADDVLIDYQALVGTPTSLVDTASAATALSSLVSNQKVS